MPVLGRTWLQPPTPRRDDLQGTTPGGEGDLAAQEPHLRTAPLDTDELAAVSAFVRAGLVDPGEASLARAQVSAQARSAAG